MGKMERAVIAMTGMSSEDYQKLSKPEKTKLWSKTPEYKADQGPKAKAREQTPEYKERKSAARRKPPRPPSKQAQMVMDHYGMPHKDYMALPQVERKRLHALVPEVKEARKTSRKGQESYGKVSPKELTPEQRKLNAQKAREYRKTPEAIEARLAKNATPMGRANSAMYYAGKGGDDLRSKVLPQWLRRGNDAFRPDLKKELRDHYADIYKTIGNEADHNLPVKGKVRYPSLLDGKPTMLDGPKGAVTGLTVKDNMAGLLASENSAKLDNLTDDFGELEWRFDKDAKRIDTYRRGPVGELRPVLPKEGGAFGTPSGPRIGKFKGLPGGEGMLSSGKPPITKPKNPTRFNMVSDIYESMMGGFGATPGEILDEDIRGAGQRAWNLDPSKYDPNITSNGVRMDTFFNPDGSMKQTTERAVQAGYKNGIPMGQNPDTKPLSVSEKWMRDRQIKVDHLYGQNAVGGKPLSRVPGNKTYGWRIPDQQLGPSHTVDSLMGTTEELMEYGDVDGKINMSKADYDSWYKELKTMGASDPEIQKILDNYNFDSFDSSAKIKNKKTPRYTFMRQDALPSVPEGLVGTGKQVGRTADSVLDTTGEVVPGAKKTLATAGKNIDMATGKGAGILPDVKPFTGAGTDAISSPAQIKLDYDRGLEMLGGRGSSVDNAVRWGKYSPVKRATILKTLKGVGPGFMGAAIEMIINATDPEANQRGRDAVSGLVGKHGDTNNWFGGSEEHDVGTAGWRKNNRENVGRFVGSMLADPVYTIGGRIKSELDGTNTNKFKTKKGKGMQGRFGLIQ